MGIIHCTFMRSKGQVRMMHHHLIDGKTHSTVEFLDLPLTRPEGTPDEVVFRGNHYQLEILEPYKKFRLTLNGDDLSAVLNYSDRFDVYDFQHGQGDGSDANLDVRHYEQGMFVEGEITLGGETRAIKCLGHRDHTWGFRDESGLGGWNWAAIQCENSTYNLTYVARQNTEDTVTGFVSYGDRSHAVIGMKVLAKEHNDAGEPVKAKYRVTLDNDEVLHVTAEHFMRLHLPYGDGYIVHENFSEFLIEETGETGVGIDEHMIPTIDNIVS